MSGLDQHCCEGNDHELQSTRTITQTYIIHLPESTHTIAHTTIQMYPTYLPESTHTINHIKNTINHIKIQPHSPNLSQSAFTITQTYTIHLNKYLKDLCYEPTGTRSIIQHPTSTVTSVLASPTINADMVTRVEIVEGLNV